MPAQCAKMVSSASETRRNLMKKDMLDLVNAGYKFSYKGREYKQ